MGKEPTAQRLFDRVAGASRARRTRWTSMKQDCRSAKINKSGGISLLRRTLCERSIGEEEVLHLSNQSLLAIILVGIIAGWLAGRVMEGGGFGLIGDLIVGLIGAFIGDWLLPRLGIHLGVGIVAAIMNAFIGAVVLLLILRLLSGGFGYRRGWRSW
jgi:uncharacterized membrane protein YeaQ/YmgE (transglycosylase-associated protein family)